jgi:nucleoside kinase
MKRYDVIASGYVSMDRIVKIRNPARVGYTSIVTNGDNARIWYGGCPINIAYLLSTLGLASLPIVRVGRDWIDNGFRDFLRAGKVSLDAIEVVEDDTTSNCYLIEDGAGEHVTVFYPGAQDGKYARPMKRDFFDESRIAVMTVGSTADNLEFFRNVKAAGLPLVFGMKADFDAFPAGTLDDFLRYSSIIFTNESERKEIERRMSLGSITDLLDAGSARVIVTTKGKSGSVFYEKRDGRVESASVPAAPSGHVVDTTGSGDAYMAGFLYGYLKGRDTPTCCALGSALAAFIIEAAGCCTNAPSEAALLARCEKKE